MRRVTRLLVAVAAFGSIVVPAHTAHASVTAAGGGARFLDPRNMARAPAGLSLLVLDGAAADGARAASRDATPRDTCSAAGAGCTRWAAPRFPAVAPTGRAGTSPATSLTRPAHTAGTCSTAGAGCTRWAAPRFPAVAPTGRAGTSPGRWQ